MEKVFRLDFKMDRMWKKYFPLLEEFSHLAGKSAKLDGLMNELGDALVAGDEEAFEKIRQEVIEAINEILGSE